MRFLSQKVVVLSFIVRPILEYGSAAWDPSWEKNFQKLEGVQKKTALLQGQLKPVCKRERNAAET